MSALVEPSRDASQPLTPHVATRHRLVGSCFRRLAVATFAALERTRSISPSDQNRSTVPSFGGAISSVARRWRNDSRRLPSCRILCLLPQLRPAFQPCTPDASRRRTEPFVVLSLLRSSMTPAHRFARVLVLAQHLCGDHLVPCGTRLHRPSLLIRSRDERLPSVSADRAVCDGLTRPPVVCLATVRGARARCVRPTSASHCFDYEHSRRIRSQHLFEACASPLRPGLAPWRMEAGGPGGSRRLIRFGG